MRFKIGIIGHTDRGNYGHYLDMAFVGSAIWSARALRYWQTDAIPPELGPIEIACAVITMLVSAVIFLRLGLYRAVIRFMGQQAVYRWPPPAVPLRSRNPGPGHVCSRSPRRRR